VRLTPGLTSAKGMPKLPSFATFFNDLLGACRT
jgi:hypothetical protein